MATGYATDLTEWTVAFWVKSPAAPSGGTYSGPVHREQNFEVSWDHVDPAFRGSAALSVAGVWYPASFGPLAPDTWYHLAATYDGETLKAYKDGILETSNAAPSGPPDPETNQLTIGKTAGTGPWYFQGIVDDVQVFARALSLEEILTLTVIP